MTLVCAASWNRATRSTPSRTNWVFKDSSHCATVEACHTRKTVVHDNAKTGRLMTAGLAGGAQWRIYSPSLRHPFAPRGRIVRREVACRCHRGRPPDSSSSHATHTQRPPHPLRAALRKEEGWCPGRSLPQETEPIDSASSTPEPSRRRSMAGSATGLPASDTACSGYRPTQASISVS